MPSQNSGPKGGEIGVRAGSDEEPTMINVPKGILRLAALKMFSESSLSGADLASEIRRVTDGEWNPGPGSIYLMIAELLKKGLVTELPKREGNVRRYIISSKGKEELSRLTKETESDVARQLRLLALYSSLAGRKELKSQVLSLANALGAADPATKD